MIYRIQDTNTNHLFEQGLQRGESIGFYCLQDMFSVVKGSTLYLMGPPHCGKTEFTFEMLINLSIFYGWKHLIWSPETGKPRDIVAELSAKYIEKDFTKDYNNQMSETERYKAKLFLEDHFVIVDFEEDITPYEYYQEANRIEKELGIKFDTTLIDPWNELKHDKGRSRDDEYLEDVLKYIRQDAAKYNRYNIISTHCRDQQPVKTKDNVYYYPAPSPRDYAGGQVWYRKGMAMLGFWRPPFGLANEHGEPYGANELQVEVHKAKPKGVADARKSNRTAQIFYDVEKHRYYEQLATGTRYASKIDFKAF